MKRMPPAKLFSKADPRTAEDFDAVVESCMAAASEDDEQHALRELESLYQRKLMLQEEKVQQLLRERNDAQLAREEERVRFEEALAASKREAAEQAAQRNLDHDEASESIKGYSEYIKKHYELAKTQVEEEHEFEAASLHAEVAALRRGKLDRSLLEARTKQIIGLKRDLEVLKEELLIQKSESLNQMAEQEEAAAAHLDNETCTLTDAKTALTAKLREKATEGLDLAQRVERLADERRTLTFRLAEANERVGPLENEIFLLHEQTDSYEADQLKNIATLNATLKKVTDQQIRLKTMAKELHVERLKTRASERTVELFSQDIHELVHVGVGALEDPSSAAAIKKAVMDIYDRYVAGTVAEERLQDPDRTVADSHVLPSALPATLPMLELARQRDTLQRYALAMQRNASREATKLGAQKRKSNGENTKLLEENKLLRRQLQEAASRASQLEKRTTIRVTNARARNRARGNKPGATAMDKEVARVDDILHRVDVLRSEAPQHCQQASRNSRARTRSKSRNQGQSQAAELPKTEMAAPMAVSAEWAMRGAMRPTGKR